MVYSGSTKLYPEGNYTDFKAPDWLMKGHPCEPVVLFTLPSVPDGVKATPPPRGGKIRKDLQREGGGVASRFFQLLSDHAAIGPYLVEKTKTIQSDSGERRSRHHLFAKCRPVQGAAERRREGLRVEASTSAGRQTAFPG